MAHRLRRAAAATVLAVPLVALPVAAPAAVAAADYHPGSVIDPFGRSAHGYGGLGGGGYGDYGSDGAYSGYPSYATEAATLNVGAATAQESKGVVLVDTVLDYGTGEAAGTGLVLTSDGTVVTNHHVIANSTSITVTIPSTGRSYVGDVVGYDATDDVAVLHLEGASGLATVTPDTGSVAAGTAVTAVGNAEGGGALLAAAGTVTATGSHITVSDDRGGTESLSDLIQVDADVVSGDSGGALLDVDGAVVGMNVAASNGSPTITGYAIPISGVLDIASSIMAGDTTGDIQLGYDGALGVQLYLSSGAPEVVGVLEGGAAAAAGVTPGSTITSFGGSRVTARSLTTAIAGHAAGDSVRVGWTDAAGTAHTATVTLGRAPVA